MCVYIKPPISPQSASEPWTLPFPTPIVPTKQPDCTKTKCSTQKIICMKCRLQAFAVIGENNVRINNYILPPVSKHRWCNDDIFITHKCIFKNGQSKVLKSHQYVSCW